LLLTGTNWRGERHEETVDLVETSEHEDYSLQMDVNEN
jgi:hypothetical protein